MDAETVDINHIYFRAWEEGDTEVAPPEPDSIDGVELTLLRFRAWQEGDA